MPKYRICLYSSTFTTHEIEAPSAAEACDLAELELDEKLSSDTLLKQGIYEEWHGNMEFWPDADTIEKEINGEWVSCSWDE